MGVYTGCTITLSHVLGSRAFRVIGAMLAVAHVCMWLVVLTLTAIKGWSGSLFHAPCLAALDAAAAAAAAAEAAAESPPTCEELTRAEAAAAANEALEQRAGSVAAFLQEKCQSTTSGECCELVNGVGGKRTTSV